MAEIPRFNNVATARRKESSLLHAIGAGLFIDLFNARKEAYFLDLEDGTNAAAALTFRLTNGANDTVNFFTGTPLANTPTVQEVIDNPTAHFQRLAIGTNIDVRAAIAEAPDQEQAIRSGLQERRTRGDGLAQVIANAVNADKDTRTAFDTYLINARENAQAAIDSVSENALAGANEVTRRLITGFTDFVSDALFAQPRKTGDGKRVSKEQHEYNYLSQTTISSYGPTLFNETPEGGWTHLDVALRLIQWNIERSTEELPGLFGGPDAGNSGIQDFFTGQEGFLSVDPDEFLGKNFSYGNFIDSYHMRRLLAELKKLVQSTRADNVTAFITSSGQTRGEYLDNRLRRIVPNGFITLAANELFINRFDNPPRPVRAFIDATQVIQPFLPPGFENFPEGSPLQFSDTP